MKKLTIGITIVAVMLLCVSALVNGAEPTTGGEIEENSAVIEKADAKESITSEAGFALTGRTAYKMLEAQPDPKLFYEHMRLGLLYTSPRFDIVMRGSMIGDGVIDGGDTQKYLGDIMDGRYLIMDEGYMNFDLGPFAVKAGRAYQQDEVDTPYSLFINSKEIPAMQVNTRYETDRFFFENRWVSLNTRSRNIYTGTDKFNYETDNGLLHEEFDDGVNWVDRGMMYRTWGVNMGAMRFGFQESVVYLHRTFAPEYFFNPIPMYLIQILTDSEGRPWGEFANAGIRMGGFAEYKQDNDYYVTQLLIDDVNFSFLPGIPKAGTVFKLGWSLGGRKNTQIGTFGFYHAGASKFTFAATSATENQKRYKNDPWRTDQVPVYYAYRPYQYTYYPVSVYQLKSGDSIPIHYQDNYIGYKYGENSIAFMADYTNTFFKGDRKEFDFYGNLEWVLSGAKSPNNPWHEGYGNSVTNAYIVLLDGTVEHIIRSTTRVAKQMGNFNLNLNVSIGIIFNAMELQQPHEDRKEAYIFYPQKGNHRPLAMATIGGTWSLDMGL